MQSTQRTRVRKTPAGRRAEIAAAARVTALGEGLQAVTQRAVAVQASIAPALVAAPAFSQIARFDLQYLDGGITPDAPWTETSTTATP